jgi:putative flippase GtrA
MTRPLSDRQRTSLTVPLAVFLAIGMGITVASAASYWVLADLARVDANISLLLVFAVFTVVGFFAHGRITFVGHASRGGPMARLGRYAAVSVAGLMMNEFFIYLLVKVARGPVWWPVVPMILVTPWVLFAFNRFWVFPEESR